jgi:AsmA protein
MRIAIKLIFAIILIIVAGLVALPFIVDPNDYKDEISTQVEKMTGRNLTLQGDIGLSVFPWIALELGPLSLSNAEGFKADSFAKVDAAEIRIKLMPLLKKQLEMDTIVLDGLVLNLETDKEGKTNWDDLTQADEVVEEDKKPSEEKAGPALAAVSIAGVKLSNANILWSDALKGESF